MQSTSQENSQEFSDLNFIEKFPSDEFFFYLDEVGRGPLAGPVVACATSLKRTSSIEGILSCLRDLNITDSKKLTSKKRLNILSELNIDLRNLKEKVVYELFDGAIHFCVNSASVCEIDEINILQASLLAMKRSINCIVREKKIEKSVALIDGNKVFEVDNCQTYSLVKGDSKSLLIALASIIAKEYRDEMMAQFSIIYPGYGFEKHSGYPTVFHKAQIATLGVSDIHRRSFKLT